MARSSEPTRGPSPPPSPVALPGSPWLPRQRGPWERSGCEGEPASGTEQGSGSYWGKPASRTGFTPFLLELPWG